MQKLLNKLSDKEVKLIRKYPELGDRVGEISRMTRAQLVTELERHHDLELDEWPRGTVWVSVEKLTYVVPKWFHSDHSGWYLDTNTEFEEWAKDLLMQEVRIAVWEKYVAYKTKNPEERGSGYGYDYHGQFV